MITNKQLEANKRNAKLGGVKTDGGKQISRYNALTHGILKEVITGYENHFYKDTLIELASELKPIGFVENMLVERIALCFLRLFRIGKAEGELVNGFIDPYSVTITVPIEDRLHDLTRQMQVVTVKGYKPTISAEAIQQLNDTVIRYDTSIENKLYKALHELQRLQAKRQGIKVSLPTAIDIISDNEPD